MTDQTPHEVIANSLAMSYGSQIAPHTRDVDAAHGAVAALDAAGIVIVKRPTGDKVTAALVAFRDVTLDNAFRDRVAMAAALAAAAAADTRPRELHELLSQHAIRAKHRAGPNESASHFVNLGQQTAFEISAQWVAEAFNLPEVTGDE